MTKNGALHDNETRTRVLKAAARLFAERGFNRVSVRDICEAAGANVASVNYHFGDKLGLYRELISAVAEGMNRAKSLAFEAGEGAPPEAQLRVYIRRFLRQLFRPEREEDAWMDRLIDREMADPTDALDLIIEKGIKPASEFLNKLVSEVMGLSPGDWRVTVGATNIQALCLWYHNTRAVAERMVPGLHFTPEVVDGLAEYIADFSLAGLAAVAREKVPTEPPLSNASSEPQVA